MHGVPPSFRRIASTDRMSSVTGSGHAAMYLHPWRQKKGGEVNLPLQFLGCTAPRRERITRYQPQVEPPFCVSEMNSQVFSAMRPWIRWFFQVVLSQVARVRKRLARTTLQRVAGGADRVGDLQCRAIGDAVTVGVGIAGHVAQVLDLGLVLDLATDAAEVRVAQPLALVLGDLVASVTVAVLHTPPSCSTLALSVKVCAQETASS